MSLGLLALHDIYPLLLFFFYFAMYYHFFGTHFYLFILSSSLLSTFVPALYSTIQSSVSWFYGSTRGIFTVQ